MAEGKDQSKEYRGRQGRRRTIGAAERSFLRSSLCVRACVRSSFQFSSFACWSCRRSMVGQSKTLMVLGGRSLSLHLGEKKKRSGVCLRRSLAASEGSGVSPPSRSGTDSRLCRGVCLQGRVRFRVVPHTAGGCGFSRYSLKMQTGRKARVLFPFSTLTGDVLPITPVLENLTRFYRFSIHSRDHLTPR